MLRDWIKENTKSDGTTIIVNENISILPPRTFDGITGLQEVVLPKKLKKIGILSFAWCKGLREIIIPDGVVLIDDEAFRGCVNLEKVNIPSEVVGIGKMAFAFTAIREIVIPDHNHIIFCAVNFVDYHKYNSNKRSYYGIRNISDKLCRENGLSVVIPGKGSKGKSYAEYQAEKTGTSWKGKLKIAVDTLIPQVASFEELLQRLQAAGYEIKPGKYISCRAPGQERFTRLKTLGADYTEEAIKERIAGKRTKAAKAPKEQRGVSLLIDIESSIKAQESRGYEQWAKIHNLKLAAKTMNFLTEHKIEQYADLVSRIEEINAENEKTADALKSVEKRLADMAVLMKHVTTYQKTKTVYEAYRRAKDKDTYRAKQESSLILHEAAAKALKAAGVTKLPNLAAMQEEYGKLQAQKEALYTDYGKLKKQVKEYDVIKQNIDSILRLEKEPERGRETERLQ